MTENTWVGYTPNGHRLFHTEDEAKEYLKKALMSDNMWDEEYIPKSWIAKITYVPHLNIIDIKESHRCPYTNRICSYRDDGICVSDIVDEDEPIVEGCDNSDPWLWSNDEVDFIADLEFVAVEERDGN